MASKPNILVLGSLNVDYVIHTPAMPKPGESLVGDSFRQGLGGKGANQAVAASRLGAYVSMAGKLGQDPQGEQWMKALEQEGIQSNHILFSQEQPTGTAWILIEPSGENRIITLPGANYDYTEHDLSELEDGLKLADLLVIQLEMGIDIAGKAAKLASELGVPVLLNPGPVSTELSNHPMLRHITVLAPNETEAEALTGITVDSIESAKQAANTLLEWGVQQVAITMGGDGVLLADAAGVRQIPAYKVTAIDTVAAGDTFCGALAVKLCQGASFDAAASFACAAAALTVTKHGAMESIPSLIEVEKFVKSIG